MRQKGFNMAAGPTRHGCTIKHNVKVPNGLLKAAVLQEHQNRLAVMAAMLKRVSCCRDIPPPIIMLLLWGGPEVM